MAYMNQEKKKVIKTNIDAFLKTLNLKGKLKYTLRVNHYMEICMIIRSSKFDFLKAHKEVALESYLRKHGEIPEWYEQESEKVKNFEVNKYNNEYPEEIQTLFNGLQEALDTGNHNNSDSQTDYFDVGHYTRLCVGYWNIPYQQTA